MANKKLAYIYLIITFCAWGSLYVVSKFVLGKVPVITVLFLRYLAAGITLFFILKRIKVKKIERQDYKYIFMIGVVGYFGSVGAQLIGIKLANASLASLTNSMNPIATLVFASIILKEKLTVKRIVCVAMAIAGVYIVIGGVNGSGQVLGILFSVSSVITWSFITVIVRKVTQKYDAIQITTYGIIIAGICTLPIAIYELATTPDVHFDYKIILSLLYMGLVCTALGYVLWNKSLSLIEAGTCSLFYPVQPMVSFLLGWMLLGDSINTSFVFGAILIIGGVLLSIIGKREHP